MVISCFHFVSFFSQSLFLSTMNKMKNFKRRFSLSVPRTETIEENEFTEQINELNIQHTQGKKPPSPSPNIFKIKRYIFQIDVKVFKFCCVEFPMCTKH